VSERKKENRKEFRGKIVTMIKMRT
jgi:hypothetical protein